jgi:hypothetical protein
MAALIAREVPVRAPCGCGENVGDVRSYASLFVMEV